MQKVSETFRLLNAEWVQLTAGDYGASGRAVSLKTHLLNAAGSGLAGASAHLQVTHDERLVLVSLGDRLALRLAVAAPTRAIDATRWFGPALASYAAYCALMMRYNRVAVSGLHVEYPRHGAAALCRFLCLPLSWTTGDVIDVLAVSVIDNERFLSTPSTRGPRVELISLMPMDLGHGMPAYFMPYHKHLQLWRARRGPHR